MGKGYRYLLALGFAGLGVLGLVYQSFDLQWQPVPKGLPPAAALISGALMLVLAIGTLIPSIRTPSALLLTIYWLFWALLHIPGGIAGTNIESLRNLQASGAWLGLAETSAMTCGAWLLYAQVAEGRFRVAALADARWPRLVFGVACLIFGLAHFAFADFTSTMIPAWIPSRLPLAYITGVGHFAAGLAILSGVLSRLAAALEAVMMGLFVLLVHISMVAAPHGVAQLPLVLLFVAMTLTASAWAVYSSLEDRPWGLKTNLRR